MSQPLEAEFRRVADTGLQVRSPENLFQRPEVGGSNDANPILRRLDTARKRVSFDDHNSLPLMRVHHRGDGLQHVDDGLG